MLSFEDGSLDYEFDILAFWAKDGVVYSASDSGCSCPTPFEDFNSLQELERVGSVEHAESIFKDWNQGRKVDPHERRNLVEWVRARLKV